jgi:hypothetical protein
MNAARGDTHSKTIGYLLGIGWIYDFCTLNRQVDERNRIA